MSVRRRIVTQLAFLFSLLSVMRCILLYITFHGSFYRDVTFTWFPQSMPMLNEPRSFTARDYSETIIIKFEYKESDRLVISSSHRTSNNAH